MGKKKIAVIALGGNALSKPGEIGDIPQQFANTRATCLHVLKFMEKGFQLCLTHGNGPQVGNALRRVELAENEIYPLDLGICVADTEGGMGYMIQQEMRNTFLKQKITPKDVVTVITQVIIDKNDQAFKNPTKPIGRFFRAKEAETMIREKKWIMVEDAGRGWRRVVPSPRPLRIVEASVVKRLLADDVIVIACGGGGIPVIELDHGILDGLEAVIDKDYASSLLAQEIEADFLLIATGVDQVAINFGKKNQELFSELSVDKAMHYLEQGEFPKGSMGPKIIAACDFVKKTGKPAIITSLEKMEEAIEGKSGTRIVR
ncbi:MAG: carbamate kinase [Candidatus Wallbacteria bacterium]|nr:carbamate kinase [Candidatus Wallbacteria bacterium]